MFESRESLIRSFIDYRKISGRWSRTYEINLNSFDTYCKERFHDDSLSQIMVDEWLIQRKTESKASCNARTQVVRTFIVYLQERKLTSIILPAPIIAPPNQYIPHSFSESELVAFFVEGDRLVKEADNSDHAFSVLTSTVLFRTLYSSGMRTTEARLLRVSDVDLTHGIANINNTKANLQHYVVFHDDTRIMLERYNNVANRVYPQRLYFFPSSENGFITNQNLRYRFRKIWNNVSTDRAVPYDLRHAYAITNINSWIDSGVDFHDKFLYLSKSMGHTKLESTKYYYSLVPTFAETIYRLSGKDFDSIIPEVPKNG